MSKPSEPSTCCYMLDTDMSRGPSIELSYPSVDSIEPSVDSIELSYPATLPLSAATGKIVLPADMTGFLKKKISTPLEVRLCEILDIDRKKDRKEQKIEGQKEFRLKIFCYS